MKMAFTRTRIKVENYFAKCEQPIFSNFRSTTLKFGSCNARTQVSVKGGRSFHEGLARRKVKIHQLLIKLIEQWF